MAFCYDSIMLITLVMFQLLSGRLCVCVCAHRGWQKNICIIKNCRGISVKPGSDILRGFCTACPEFHLTFTFPVSNRTAWTPLLALVTSAFPLSFSFPYSHFSQLSLSPLRVWAAPTCTTWPSQRSALATGGIPVDAPASHFLISVHIKELVQHPLVTRSSQPSQLQVLDLSARFPVSRFSSVFPWSFSGCTITLLLLLPAHFSPLSKEEVNHLMCLLTSEPTC